MSSTFIGWETGAIRPNYVVRTTTHHGRHRYPRRQLRLGVYATYALTIVLLVSSLVTFGAAPAGAHTSYPRVEIVGGGWGHGRGMGQYGALGYARDHGWTSRQILDHFYGGTTQGPAPKTDRLDPQNLRVQLASMNGRSTAVTLATGRMVVLDENRKRIRTVSEEAARFVVVSGGFELQVGEGCNGPWTGVATLSGSAVGVSVELDPTDPSDDGSVIGANSQTLLGVCGPVRAWYDGEIWSHRTWSSQRTVNVVTVEQYLRGVVPNEVPASWPEAVLQAQAVAARSYVLAGNTRWGSHADTCDNTYCQVYDGRLTTRGGTRSATHSRTDAAIAATSGQVRLTSAGKVARTEFSSSTGGHTAGGDFTAVEDLGDATSSNPNATWSKSSSLVSLANRYGLGPVSTIEVTARDGHGRFGGRATEVTITFRDGTRTMSGSAVRRFFGLKSNLFDFGPVQTGPAQPDSDTDGTADPAAASVNWEPVINKMYRQLADRSPTERELTVWAGALSRNESGARLQLAGELVASENFAGQLVDGLYRSTFDRKPDSAGKAYWVNRLTSGGRDALDYEAVGTSFFGSREYYRRSGANDRGFVDNLYQDLLGRVADDKGVDYWLGVLERGSTADVVTWFYRSEESRLDRAAILYGLATGQQPSDQQVADGAKLLQSMTDLELAARYGAALQP